MIKHRRAAETSEKNDEPILRLPWFPDKQPSDDIALVDARSIIIGQYICKTDGAHKFVGPKAEFSNSARP